MVKSTTDKLVPASMVQNEPVFKLHRDVVDTMISGAGGFAAILHRHRSADRFRRTVLVLASCVDGTPLQSAIGAASNTGRNSPRHVVDACHKLLFAIGAHKNGASGRTGRNFAGGVIVLAAPHSSSFWIHGRQIVDAGNSLATCTNRATGIVMQQRIDDVANGSLKLLFAVDGVVTVHKYDENGNEVFMREIDKASDMDTVIIKELDENGNVLKMASYLNGEQNYLYTQVFNDHGDMIERDDEDGNPSIVCQYTYDDNGRKLSEESYTVSDGEQYLNYSTAYTYDDTHELPVTEVITNDSGVQTTTRDFDTMDVDGLYIETVSEDGADDIVYHKRASDNKTTYYFGQGSEVSTEYDEHGNMTKQQGKDATMGNFEQTFENTYDDNGNLISMKSAYNGDDGYFIDYTYAALNDASYNGEGTLLFDAATDTPSAA